MLHIPCGVADGPSKHLSYETEILFVGGIIHSTIMGTPRHEITIALPLRVTYIVNF